MRNRGNRMDLQKAAKLTKKGLVEDTEQEQEQDREQGAGNPCHPRPRRQVVRRPENIGGNEVFKASGRCQQGFSSRQVVE